MLIPRYIWLVSVGLMVQGASIAFGQDYPNKPIRVVTSAPGGASDFASRVIAPALTDGRAKPGELNYGSGPAGGSPHLATELFKSMAGVRIVRVNYKGAGPAVNALIGGEVQLMIPSAGTVFTHIKAGRLRALAVTTAQPSALFPGLPTVAASGLPGYETGVNTGIFVPVKTPARIIARLNQEIVRVLNRSDVKERFFSSGVETLGNSPEQFAAAIRAEIAKWSKVIKDAGVRPD